MATKAQLVDYIAENYETKDGMPASMSKLDSYKKAELEKLIEKHNDQEALDEWVKVHKK